MLAHRSQHALRRHDGRFAKVDRVLSQFGETAKQFSGLQIKLITVGQQCDRIGIDAEEMFELSCERIRIDKLVGLDVKR